MSKEYGTPSDRAVQSGGPTARPTDIETNSYMRTPVIRPVPANTQETTSQAQPAAPEKK
jgi:hypothetical protein